MIARTQLKLLEQFYRDRDWVWLNKEVEYLIQGRENKKLLILDLLLPALKHYDDWDKLKNYLKGLPRKRLCQYDKILLAVKNEALPNYRWEQILNFLVEFLNKHQKDFIVVDAGYNTNGTYPHISTNPFVDNPFLNLTTVIKNPVPFSQRKTFYNSLSRNPKIFRLLFTLELINRNLLSDGCVSFGVSDDYGDDMYEVLIPEQHKHLFPIYADGVVRRNKYTETYPASAIDSLIKIVLESTYDDAIVSGTQKNYCGGVCSDRIFLTEKTFFAFQSYQIPLFVTVRGHVQAVRDYGFDVFDDIVDHSYDKESDPDKRIKMVVDELQRLMTIKDKIINTIDIDQRLAFNNSHRQTVIENIGRNLKVKLKEWFND